MCFQNSTVCSENIDHWSRPTLHPAGCRDNVTLAIPAHAIDAALGRLLTTNHELVDGLRVIVSADHGTSSISGLHIPEPVPLLVARWSPDGEPSSFDEESAALGVLGLIHSGELSAMLWSDLVDSRTPDVTDDPQP